MASAAEQGSAALATDETTSSVDDVLAELRAGRTPPNLEVDTAAQLDQVFAQLTQGGQSIESAYPGKFVEFSDGTQIGLRATSRSGGPAVDVFNPDGTHITIHLP